MKIKLHFSFVIALPLVLVNVGCDQTATPPPTQNSQAQGSPVQSSKVQSSKAQNSKAQSSTTRVRLKVLKVFTAKDGDSIFRAYLVNWNDQDVVVTDALSLSDYHEGDSLPIMVLNLPFPFPKQQEPHRMLLFQVVPE